MCCSCCCGGLRGYRTCRSRLIEIVVLAPPLVRVLAVHLGDKVADEGLLVEGGKVGAQEVVTDSVQALVVQLREKGGKKGSLD